MKVILIGPSPRAQGGIAALMATYLRSDLARECTLLPVFTRLEGSVWIKLGMLVQALFRFLWLSLFYLPQIAHIHFCSNVSFYRKSIFVLAAKVFSQKIVFHGHGGSFLKFYQQSHWFSKKYIQKILTGVDQIVVGSENARTVMEQISGRNNVRIVSNSIADERIIGLTHNKKALQEKDNFNLLFLGRIERPKGVYELIGTAVILKEKISGVKIILGGEGEIKNARKFCCEKGVEDTVQFYGWVQGEDKIGLFKQATCFVLPSYRELQSVSVLEALAAGLPIVATDISGINEMVEDGANGFLVPVGNSRQLAEKIFLLLKDENLRQQMCENNLRKFKEKFDMKFVIRDLLQIYQNMLLDSKKYHTVQSRVSTFFTNLR